MVTSPISSDATDMALSELEYWCDAVERGLCKCDGNVSDVQRLSVLVGKLEGLRKLAMEGR